jgi:lysophospholipid acyltransferase (LPLAT)-like uncharacterized protein
MRLASNTPLSAAPVHEIRDSAVADQELFNTILEDHAGFRATSLSNQKQTTTGINCPKIVFMWHNQTSLAGYTTEKDRPSEVCVRIEISGNFILPVPLRVVQCWC